MGVAFDLGLCLHRSKALQDSTGVYSLFRDTALAKGSQLLFEMGELANAFIDVGDVLIKDICLLYTSPSPRD